MIMVLFVLMFSCVCADCSGVMLLLVLLVAQIEARAILN